MWSKAIETFIQENSDIIAKVLRVMEGKSATARIKLDGIQLELGDSMVELAGEIDLKFVPEKGSEGADKNGKKQSKKGE